MRTLPPATKAAIPLLLAVGTGVLLGLPRALPELAPLQILGFATFFLLAHGCATLRQAVKFGALAGLMSAITALILVHVHFAAAVLILLSLTANYALFGALLLLFLRRGAFGAFIAGAGVITLGEWVFAHLLPIFGTAQYTTCPWSDWPQLVRHEAVLGSCGTLLMVTLLGACVAGMVLRKERKWAARGTAAVIVLFGGLNVAASGSWRSGISPRVAAAIGPVMVDVDTAEKAYAPLIAQAASQGVTMVVLPEMAIMDSGTKDTVTKFGSMAQKYQLTLVIGLRDLANGGDVNCALALSPEGNLLVTHIKAHRINFMEHYSRMGDANQPSLAKVGLITLGILICNDDNFTDLTNASAQAGAKILTIPTLDWPGVETAHFTNSRHRAIETGLPLIRAAQGGIAAIFAPDGSVLAQRNHAKEGDGIIVADVPLAASHTPYVRSGLGDLPILVLAALTLLLGLYLAHPSTAKQ